MTENTSPENINHTPSSESENTAPLSNKSEGKVSEGEEKENITKNDSDSENEFMTSLKGKLTHETQDIKEKVSRMPNTKKVYFFTGCVLIFLSLLIIMDFLVSLFGFFVLVIGGGLIYLSFSDKNPFEENQKKDSEEK